MLRFTLVLLLCLSVAGPSAGEQPVMRLYTTDDGLHRNYVTRIRRDNRGRLWFCTPEGLSLFDGERFSNYTTADGLPHRLVHDIADVGSGVYYLATSAGLYLLRPRTAAPAAYQRVELAGAPDGTEPTVLLRGASGVVWCGTSSGLYRIRDHGKPYAEKVPLSGSGEGAVNALAEDSTGALWVGGAAGLLRVGSGGILAFPLKCRNGPVGTLLADREGYLWTGYWGGRLAVRP
jgi:ligand-binding sensor domain-containing protein